MTEANKPTDSANNITLVCVVNGHPAKDAFKVETEPSKSIDHLKKLIKVAKAPKFDDVAADELTLWSTSIPIIVEEEESAIILDTQDKKTRLHPASELSEVFGDNLPKKTIHIIVHRPPSAPKLSSRIKLKVILRTQPRRELSWTTDAMQSTLMELTKVIYDNFPDLPHSSQSDDTARIAIHQLDVDDPVYPINDKQLQTILQLYIEQRRTSMIVDLETPTKLLSTYSLYDVDVLYGLSASCSGRLSHCRNFHPIDSIDLHSDERKQALHRLYMELENRIDTTLSDSLSLDDEDISTFVGPFLHYAAGLFKDQLRVRPKRLLSGSRGSGLADFLIESRSDQATRLIVTETKHSDFASGVAQNMVQLESTLMQQQKETRKRKRDDDIVDDAVGETLVCHGVVTDAFSWRFVECKLEPTTDSTLLYPKFQ
ncbi:hypothetical protein BGX28_009959 [Mortierella sp. GBA30]|nr:hypothetical protein BGX28_009959 [Mortierella sp. GBA30]